MYKTVFRDAWEKELLLLFLVKGIHPGFDVTFVTRESSMTTWEAGCGEAL